MLRSKAEREAEVKALRELLPKIRRYSAFGDNHRAAISAQIQVIEGNMSNDEIFDMEESGEWASNVREAASDALDWLEGRDLEEGPNPAKTWESLKV